ncbi:hypothetical protein ACFOYW_12880 [Gryllotalpicola reticulitermitis]|uniref:FHA domain-containing protein n=1 Tax=Gryllotalpicola reticulitermitis TaxID=1184153 RepID=A0ABV8Q7G8_9MICO
MTFSHDLAPLLVFYVAVAVLAVLVWCLIVYLVLRLAITHGLRAHQRWIDDGKP